MSDRGQLFVGEQGMIYSGGRSGPILLPEEKFKDYSTPPETLPRSPGHYIEWINACKGQGPPPGSNFQYSGWVTESNHLGNVAYRTGKSSSGTTPTSAPPTRRRPTNSSGVPTEKAGMAS